ncbi:MAG: hypothetical protein AAGD11_02575 [Planctomycetota bacterium]
MINRYNISLLYALICALGLYYLGTNGDSGSSEVPTSIASRDVTSTKPSSVEEVADEAYDETTADEDQTRSADPVPVVFDPPFPDRVALFQAPKRQGRGRIKPSGQSDSAIELLGFVNVNGPRVALSFDGLVRTAAEGDKYYGIEVISIKPPAVVLQRGRQRWQATFDN